MEKLLSRNRGFWECGYCCVLVMMVVHTSRYVVVLSDLDSRKTVALVYLAGKVLCNWWGIALAVDHCYYWVNVMQPLRKTIAWRVL